MPTKATCSTAIFIINFMANKLTESLVVKIHHKLNFVDDHNLPYLVHNHSIAMSMG